MRCDVGGHAVVVVAREVAVVVVLNFAGRVAERVPD